MSTLPSASAKLRALSVWHGQHRGIAFKIVNWNFDRSSGTSLRDDHPSGCWNFYLYLHETKVHDFASIWLPPKITRLSPESSEWITYDYYSSPLSGIEMHGDITWYEKQGEVPGHRTVDIGCDYQHSFDVARRYTVEGVAADARRAIDSAYEQGILKPKES